jgi:putative zinc finger protein
MSSSQPDQQYGGAHVAGLLPAYLNDTLDTLERDSVAAHLVTCAACRTELQSWQAIGDVSRETFAMTSAAPSAATMENIWARIDQRPRVRAVVHINTLRRRMIFAHQLVRAQARLIPSGIWILSAAALFLCFTGMLFWRMGSYPHSILGAFVPLITAVGVSFIYGPESDDSLEVTLATPVSPRAVLLSRMALVFSFNFALGLLMTLALVVIQGDDFSVLIAYWVGPTLLLAGLSLLLSLTISSLTGLACVGVLWLARFVGSVFAIPGSLISSGTGPLGSIWQTTPATLLLACALLVAAVLYVPHQRRLSAS